MKIHVKLSGFFTILQKVHLKVYVADYGQRRWVGDNGGSRRRPWTETADDEWWLRQMTWVAADDVR